MKMAIMMSLNFSSLEAEVSEAKRECRKLEDQNEKMRLSLEKLDNLAKKMTSDHDRKQAEIDKIEREKAKINLDSMVIKL